MTAPGTPADPRPRLGAALDQTQHQIDAIGAADLHRPTACGEYDVRTMLAHLVAVLRKLTVAGDGGDPGALDDPATDPVADLDGWRAAFRRARADFERKWASDPLLPAEHTMPWGTMTGYALLDAYAHEFTVHAWDLTAVTGLADRLDPVLAEAALAWYTDNVPAGARADGGPFGPVVPVAADAEVYARLAGFVGREPRDGIRR